MFILFGNVYIREPSSAAEEKKGHGRGEMKTQTGRQTGERETRRVSLMGLTRWLYHRTRRLVAPRRASYQSSAERRNRAACQCFFEDNY
jgi:hypothetical protein